VSDTGPETSEPRAPRGAGPTETASPLERGFFREGDDGAAVFFPWGLEHRGYVLPDEAAKRRARRAVSLMVFAVLAVSAWAAEALRPFVEPGASPPGSLVWALAWPLAALGAVVGVYALWVSRLAERFPESDLRVSRDARLREAALLAPPWKVGLVGLATVAMSVLLVWLDPRAMWLGLAGALTGGALVLWARALQRVAAPRPGAGDAAPPSRDLHPL